MKVYDKISSAGISAGKSSLTFRIGDNGKATVILDHLAFEQIGKDFDLIKGKMDDNLKIGELIKESLKIVVDA